jgi:hypothetical protein
MAVLAAAAFSTSTTVAQADVMSAGTWDGKITGGTLSLGDEDLRGITVPAGDPFTFTIPTGAGAPVPFTAPAMHVAIPLITETETDALWAVAGSLDLAPVIGTVDPATGAVAASSTAHGLLHLDFATPSMPGSGSSIYCQLGDAPAPPETPAPPAPFNLSVASANAGGAAWSAASGTATLTDKTFTANRNCGAPFITPATDLRIIGHPVMTSGMNELSLTATFTRRPDPAPETPVKPPVTPAKPKVVPAPPTPVVVKCLVPKLKGMKLKQARKAAKKANCAVGKVQRKKSSRKATTVIKQGAPVGAILAQGSKIRLTVAR